MARVFIYFDEPMVKQLLIYRGEDEGHEIIGAVDTVEEALAVLRSTLHPLIAILERDHSSRHPDTPLFPTIRQYPEMYGQHRYITVHWWKLSAEEQALLGELHMIVFTGSFRAEAMLDAVARSAALLPE